MGEDDTSPLSLLFAAFDDVHADVVSYVDGIVLNRPLPARSGLTC
jgi:hypothetical protein